MNNNNDVGGAPRALSLILIQFRGWLNRENILNDHKIFVEPMLLGGLLPATLQYRTLVKNKYLGLVYAFLKKKFISGLFAAGLLIVIQKLYKVPL